MTAIRTKQEAAADAKKEIQIMLNADMDSNLTKKWTEHKHLDKPLADLPEGLIEDFKAAVMQIPAKELKVQAARIKTISDKEVKDLLYGEVSFILNALNSCVPSAYSGDFEEFMEKRQRIDVLTALYNEKFQAIEEALRAREVSLSQLLMPKPDNQRSKFHA